MTRAANVAPVAYLASPLLTLPVQEELLVGWDVPVVVALKQALSETLPGFPFTPLEDPEFVGVGLQLRVNSFLCDYIHNRPRALIYRRRALSALPAQERFVEVVESAAQPQACAWLQALPLEISRAWGRLCRQSTFGAG